MAARRAECRVRVWHRELRDLTADRLGSLGATTVAGGLRISLPSLTLLTTTWEHQWRSNNTAIDRVTLSITQSFP
jgi:hypothetical protein